MAHAFSAMWQVEQLRPLLPCAWKYSPLRLTKACVLEVAANPFGFKNGKLLGRDFTDCASA
jgi:hypothetical protein